ncbi:DEAD/DEAH box helicase [Rheinheimera baltica]|uniref:DEAD/DEAH box helicase n=1 Tax=Rheinheimera baltica TaxID=67576 RepID=A0ABT9I423_9GAMM|nr:DEAD/DEAH box helicase [Rheinheimera baltica]MDP5138124.1 DEAD/DEAH box helicase [Rheinheimera baltica]MDP5143008.1 DEAD/DEAH box helicase [Rheinheimera baltica]MDP5149713.1 DEAD/DEAH box helicase [Rheinheimera baltica]MDP5190118.1 DEAD/DEAH box helicase [Rheinheimera baltica]
MQFSSLDLAPDLQRALVACGYSAMTPVQAQAIVPARRGKDLQVTAQTGTGKTAAFAIPILQRMLDKPKATVAQRPRALILTPTRELAEQLANTIAAYAQFSPISVTALYGGVKMGGQANKLNAGVDIVISTPGRLLEHMALGNVILSDVEFVVLDEADRMLDMGFITDVLNLLQQTGQTRQTLLFSATTSPAVNELSHKILKNHQQIRVAKVNSAADTVNHVVYPVEEGRKIELFEQLLAENNWFQVLVFTSTKEQADRLLAGLQQRKIDAAVCHGDKSQGARRRAIADFKSAKLQVLIATEVAARGLDIQGLDYVVNFNLPYLPEDYVHRIGRTGRAGASGNAISFVSREEEQTLQRIQRLMGSDVKRVIKPGFEVSNRESLLKNNARKVLSGRSNKSTETQIELSNTAKTKPKVKAKPRSSK